MATQYEPIVKDSTLNTTESTPRNLADVLASGLANIANNVKPNGSDISINVPGMSANNVNEGFSELKQSLVSLTEPSTLLTSSHNLNNITTHGTYYTRGSDNPSNCPAVYNNIIYVFGQDESDRIIQQLQSVNANSFYQRTRDKNGNWTAWIEFATKSDLDNLGTVQTATTDYGDNASIKYSIIGKVVNVIGWFKATSTTNETINTDLPHTLSASSFTIPYRCTNTGNIGLIWCGNNSNNKLQISTYLHQGTINVGDTIAFAFSYLIN